MKRIALITQVWLMIVFLAVSCQEPPEKTETDRFEQELQNFNQTMGELGQTMDMMDAMQKEVDMVEQQRSEGQITDEQADKLLNEIKQTYGRAIARRSKSNPASGLPVWARELGLTEPVGLLLDPDYSQMTSADNPTEGFNSIMLVYSGTYQTAMSEAERIAAAAGIPLSKDYEQAIELSVTYGSTPIKGIAYMNFDPFISDNDVNISIIVDEEGILSISAVDIRQMRRTVDDYDGEDQ